uniref:B2 protein n=1 Tax=Anthurium amnicola TaxID=1678845 RepID=A0A1D1Y4G0_9ARAE
MVKGKKQRRKAPPAAALGAGKKFLKPPKKKGKDPVSPPAPSGPEQTPPAAKANVVKAGGSAGKTVQDAGQRIAGFIFMCNGKTKPECYKYRVFGLPKGRLEVVEKIKKGTKLFLFDCDLKLLYGVYKATSPGGLNLEAAAFGGNFPSQVKFKIFKDCVPLPEGSFKHAIKENYNRNKFDSELNFEQVQKLLSLFRPIGPNQQSSIPHGVEERHPQAPDGQHRSGRLPYGPSRVDRFAPRGAPPPASYPNAPAAQMAPAPSVVEAQHFPPTDAYGRPVAVAGMPPPRDAYGRSVAVSGMLAPRHAYYQPGTGLPPPRDAYYQPASGLPPPRDAYYQPTSSLLQGDAYYEPATRLPPTNGVYHPADVVRNQLDSEAYYPENPVPNDAYYPAAVFGNQLDPLAYYPETPVPLEQYKVVPHMRREQPPAPPARDYRSLTVRDSEMASQAERLPRQKHWALGYEDQNRTYTASLYKPNL